MRYHILCLKWNKGRLKTDSPRFSDDLYAKRFSDDVWGRLKIWNNVLNDKNACVRTAHTLHLGFKVCAIRRWVCGAATHPVDGDTGSLAYYFWSPVDFWYSSSSSREYVGNCRTNKSSLPYPLFFKMFIMSNWTFSS